MLTDIQTELKGLVRQSWASDVQSWGERVALYRQYAAGDHRAKLTTQMRAMLRVSDDRLDRFNANYCGLVIEAMSDRLIVTSIEGGDQAATAWAKGLQESNRFDSLQMDVNEAALRDGDTFVMEAFDEETKEVLWVHEPAYDGDTGIIPVYDRMRRRMLAVIKVWYEGDARLANLYSKGAIKKYIWEGTKEAPAPQFKQRDEPADWTDVRGAALGVPFVHFKNRPSTSSWHGESELVNAIPLQDVLNRTITSMVMVAELSAFPIPIARGFTPPAALMPGAWITIGAVDGLTKDVQVGVDVLPQASLVPFISEAEFTINQIGSVTQTPLLSNMGGSLSSGEALKQRETGLIGKTRRAQTRFGNAWEDVVRLAARLQTAYGNKAPESKIWRAVWQDASPRNDSEVIDNALKVRELVGDEETLNLIGKVLGYDQAKIKMILAQKDAAAEKSLSQMPLPGFENFGRGTDLNEAINPTSSPSPLRREGGNAQVIDPQAIEQALAASA